MLFTYRSWDCCWNNFPQLLVPCFNSHEHPTLCTSLYHKKLNTPILQRWQYSITFALHMSSLGVDVLLDTPYINPDVAHHGSICGPLTISQPVTFTNPHDWNHTQLDQPSYTHWYIQNWLNHTLIYIYLGPLKPYLKQSNQPVFLCKSKHIPFHPDSEQNQVSSTETQSMNHQNLWSLKNQTKNDSVKLILVGVLLKHR